VWGGGSPSLLGGGVWGEGHAPSPEFFFSDLELKMASFGAFCMGGILKNAAISVSMALAC